MSTLESIENIRLAWKRILTGQNNYYREFQKIEVNAFAWAEEENLIQLRNELINHVYEPSEATKVFIPKASGLLRPITILRIRDTIIYQAIVNLIAEKVYDKFSDFYFKLVFSNILQKKSGHQSLFRDWKFCRRKLDTEKREAFQKGYIWIGKLDLASFYDIIDHQLLRKILLKLSIHDDIIDLLIKCLGRWTLYPKGFEHGHGIPQGPLASSLLAECILHYLDKLMVGLRDSVYLRYVDDITIMSKSEKDARKQFARIELICRQLGLVPTIKSAIRKYQKVEDTIVDELSPSVSVADFPFQIQKLDKARNDRIRKIFLDCFKGDKIRRSDDVVTKLRFSLFRMNSDKRMLKRIFYLLVELPCTYDAVNYYLRRFGCDKEICLRIIQYLNSEPLYHIATDNSLETLYFCCVKGYYSGLRMHSVKALSPKNNVILRCSGVKVLCLRGNYTNRFLDMLNGNSEVYLRQRLLFSMYDNLSQSSRYLILNQYIKSSSTELALIASYLLTRDNIKLSRARRNINAWSTPILAKFGLIKKQVIGDKILEIIRKRYNTRVTPSFNFRKILRASDYRQALFHLNQAEGTFDTQRAFWLVQMDCFNQLLLYSIFNRKLKMPIHYDNVFASIDSNQLKTKFPNVSLIFKEFHKKRSSSFISHAYSKEKNAYTTDLRIYDRNKLRRRLALAYSELVNKY